MTDIQIKIFLIVVVTIFSIEMLVFIYFVLDWYFCISWTIEKIIERLKKGRKEQ